MHRQKPRDGLTLIEVLIMLAVLTAIAAMLVPAIQASREMARRGSCVNNLKQLGLGFHGYAQAHRDMPPSSGVTRNADGTISAVDGWSWQVLMLPYMDRENQSGDWQTLYNRLDVGHGCPLVEPAGAKGTPHADALATRLPWLLCPNFRGSPYADAAGKEAITNYKAMGATHIESLSVASPHPLTPKYSPFRKQEGTPVHPDGACFPGTSLSFAHIRDGTTNTILAAESVEQRFARWTVGAEATVVGLPRNVEFEVEGGLAPKGYNRPRSDDSVYWTYRTYLDWDCDASPYDGADGTIGGKYGPSSHHAHMVNHLFMDCSVRAISKEIGVAIYMALITRNGRFPPD